MRIFKYWIAEVKLLWYNSVIENNELNTITIADTKITKKEQEEHNLKSGDFVKLQINADKFKNEIIWNWWAGIQIFISKNDICV